MKCVYTLYKNPVILWIALILSFNGIAQNDPIKDSLVAIVKSDAHDTLQCAAYFDLAMLEKKRMPAEALRYFTKAEKIIIKHLNKDKHPNEYYQREHARAVNGKGIAFRRLGNYGEALVSYFEAQDIQIARDDQEGLSSTYFNIGAIYRYQDELDRSLKSYKQSLAIRETLNDTLGILNCYNAIGIVNRKLEQYDVALKYYLKSLKISISRKDTSNIIQGYMNVGVVYSSNREHSKAEKEYTKALILGEKISSETSIANARNNLAGAYLGQGEYHKAIDYAKKALAVYEKKSALEKIRNSHLRLSLAYEKVGNNKKAVFHLREHNRYKDQLENEEVTKNLVRIEMNHGFEKEKLADSISHAKQIEISDLEIQGKNAVIAKSKAQNIALFGGVFLFSILALVAFRSYRRKKNDNEIITKEKERSDELLLNILPEETAEELKEYGSAKARSYDLVSVLFTDFKGFTMISEVLSPEELVAEIDHCYKEFDRIMGKYNIEKIKTIGDAYMCAGGLPGKNDTHPVDTVNAALEIRNFMLKYKKEREAEGRPGFEIRIGIHTGPVVAGIVGIKKFAYDIWGDAVNTAARMESSGQVGKVNISYATHDFVKDLFECEHRGKVAAKNKGDIDMDFVERKGE